MKDVISDGIMDPEQVAVDWIGMLTYEWDLVS